MYSGDKDEHIPYEDHIFLGMKLHKTKPATTDQPANQCPVLNSNSAVFDWENNTDND
jgi:hypothetical protein